MDTVRKLAACCRDERPVRVGRRHASPLTVPSVTHHREIVSMSNAMGAFTVAARLLGNLTLSPAQLAQLRAIDRKYQQALFTLLDGTQRAPTAAEISTLDDSAARDILAMLTPDQLAALPVR